MNTVRARARRAYPDVPRRGIGRIAPDSQDCGASLWLILTIDNRRSRFAPSRDDRGCPSLTRTPSPRRCRASVTIDGRGPNGSRKRRGHAQRQLRVNPAATLSNVNGYCDLPDEAPVSIAISVPQTLRTTDALADDRRDA